MGADGEGGILAVVSAIRYAADRGADVINMSLGGVASCPDSIQEAADYAYGKGVLLVAAAGNHDSSHPNGEMFPADCEHVLGVAATNSDDGVASYSNYGDHVSVAAPGTKIYSTVMYGWYGEMSGTSMATPHVAGLAAMVRARFPRYTPDQIASAILDNALDLGASGWDRYSGCGRIDSFSALSEGAQGASPVCLGSAGPWAVDGAGPSTDAPFAPGEIIVAFRPGLKITERRSVLRRGIGSEHLPALDAWRLRVPPGRERAVLKELQADPNVAYAELNYLVFPQ